MKNVLILAATVIIAAASFSACRKDGLLSFLIERIIAEDITAHNDLSEQIDADADAVVDQYFQGADDRSDCPTVSFAQPKGTWPNTITFDYSEAGCVKNDKTYQGKIIINQSNAMNVVGAVRTITYDKFSYEGVRLEGQKTVENIGLSATGKPAFSIVVEHNLVYPNGSNATHTANRLRTIEEGFDTPAKLDDVFFITGSGSGTNRNGVAYTMEIVAPIVKKVNCPWISQGVVTFTNDTKSRSIDYGDGTCDKIASLILPDGTEKTIQIRHFWWK
jgi:hypothetical protein